MGFQKPSRYLLNSLPQLHGPPQKSYCVLVGMCSRSSDSNCLLIYLHKIIYAPTFAVNSIFSFLIYTPGGVIFSSTSRNYPLDSDPKVKNPKLCSTLMFPYLNSRAPFWKDALHPQVLYSVQMVLLNHKRGFGFGGFFCTKIPSD